MSEYIAGRELDALVAAMLEPMPERLGDDAFQSYLTGANIPSPGGAWRAVWVYNSGDVQEWVPRPFSTDIAAAWWAVEAMRERGLSVSVTLYWSGAAWADVMDNVEQVAQAKAESVPLAICRVALAALGAP